jgi:copper chaperone
MQSLEVKGMSCGHCVASVTDALNKLPGLTDVQVSLEKGLAEFKTESPLSESEVEQLKQAITKIGFEPGNYTE